MNVTIHPNPTPSEQLTTRASETVTVNDDTGRAIVLRRPTLLMQYRLIEAIGAEAAKNDVYRALVAPLIYVQSIDGQIAPQPSNKDQVEALIQRIGECGLQAIMDGIARHFSEPDPIATRDAVKNS